MAKRSAGILLHRRSPHGLEVLLAHPGGPYWANKDAGAWTLPKGEPEEGEDPLACAVREFQEETGLALEGPFRELGEVTQKGGKVVAAWTAEGDADPDALESGTFVMEWPPRSGRTATFPEVDRWGWFPPAEARRLINPAQAELVDRLEALLR